MSIQAIDRSSIHRLTSGQVVIDLQTAVKELVENALDAGGTYIKITFREHGLEAFEVEDNGKGIEQSDWEGIALKHHTSKLTSFSDLALVSTLGFRGEALSSLCGTATLSMITSPSSSKSPIGTCLSFSSAGECVVGGKTARNKGTTVKVERLFEKLPVRRKELEKNVKREFGKAVELVQAYALINIGVRFEVRNVMKGRAPQTHLQTPITSSTRSIFSSVYSPKELPQLLDLDLTLDVATEKSVLKRLEGSVESTTLIKVKGLISKPTTGSGRTSGNRQFYYINGRPFSPSKIAKAVNEVYKSFNSNQFPTVVADFQLPADAYDVNVSPDKRTIFLHSEGNLISALKSALHTFFQPSQATYAMSPIGPAKTSSSSASNGAASSAPTSEGDEMRTEKRRSGRDREKGKEVRLEEEEGFGEAEVQQKDGDDADAEEGGEDERPRKRRKSSLPPSSIAAEKEAREAPADAYGQGEHMDVDVAVDASQFTSRSPVQPSQALSPPSALDDELGSANRQIFDLDFSAHDNDDPNPILPIPPSPIRRAYPEPSSEPAATANMDDATQEAHDDGPRPRSRSASLPLAHTVDQSLFRSSPSPSLRPPSRSPSPSSFDASHSSNAVPGPSRSPSHSPAPAPASSNARAQHANWDRVDNGKLKQPRLSFGGGGGGSGGEGEMLPPSGRGKGKGKEWETAKGKGKKREPVKEMKSRLQKFVKGSQAVKEEVEEDGDDEVEVEEADKQDNDELEIQEGSGRGEEEEHEEDDDDMLIVEDSQADVPHASCACVHGSPHAAADVDDSDLEISEPVKQRAPSPAAAALPTDGQPLPFGSAPAEVAGTLIAADTSLPLDFAALEAQWAAPHSASLSSSPPVNIDADAETASDGTRQLSGAGIEEKDEAAEATLSRVVSKEDFGTMKVLGQFNLGFIIARRRVEVLKPEPAGEGEEGEDGGKGRREVQDDLFIIDQHASDEKYNFETLQSETVIQSQRLLAPRILNLPSHDEITAIDHADLLRLNGFDVVIDEDADVGERVKLLAQPVSKDTVFDVGDFEELLDLISSRSGNEVVRPSKARKMFASRACRKSVMIGKALNSKQMTQIVRHMGGMDQPWACPHGRPTMRWLFGLGNTSSSTSRDSRSDLVKLLEAYE